MILMNKTFIGPSYIREEFINNIQKKESAYIFDVAYKSIEEIINNIKIADDFNTTKNIITTLSLDKFNKAIEDDDFIKELVMIKNELVKFDTSVNNLKIDDELKTILNSISIKYDYDLLDDSYSNCSILDVGYDLFEEKIINFLVNKGANFNKMPISEHKSYKVKAINIAKQIEIVIQHIINNNLNLNDCAVVLCDESNLAIYESVLNRYQMPYKYINGNKNKASNKFISIVDYYLDPSINNYLQIINYNAGIKTSLAINEYLLDHFNGSNVLETFNFFKDSKENYYQKLEEEAEKTRIIVEPLIKEINNCNSLLDAFTCAFNHLDDGDDKDEISSYLSNVYSKDINKENYESIRNDILNLKSSIDYIDSLLLTTLHKHTYRKYLFVLDASNINFPGFKTFDGVIKEDDVLNTNFPTIKNRRDNLYNSLKYLDYSKETFFFISATSYDGKDIKFSLSINAEEIELPLIDNQVIYKNTHIIDKELIKNYYLKDNTIKGSISSVEKYYACPYSYFLRYVLNLKTDDKKELAANTIGSLFHKVLDHLCKNDKKQYFNYTKESILEIIDEDIKDLKKYHPNDIKMIDFTINNFIEALLTEKEFFEVLENESSFNVENSEYPFNQNIFKYDNVSLYLKGFIDRIDQKDNYFRILDYKSSKKTMNIENFKKGLSLQLLTYAYMYSLENNTIPIAVYYVKLNTSIDSDVFYKYTKTKGLEKINKDLFKEFINNQKLSGLSFGISEADYIYSNKTTIPSHTKRNTIDFELVKEGLNVIYTNLIKQICNGNFIVDPDKDACRFCDYKSICHHRGLCNEKTALFNFEEE